MAETVKQLYAGDDAVVECQRPFPDDDAANKALKVFFEELYDLRVKHKVANVLVAVSDQYIADGEPRGFMHSTMFGQFACEEQLAAFAFGRAQSVREQTIGDLLTFEKPKPPKRRA